MDFIGQSALLKDQVTHMRGNSELAPDASIVIPVNAQKDLTPLQGMPLTSLSLIECWVVDDLSPLEDRPRPAHQDQHHQPADHPDRGAEAAPRHDRQRGQHQEQDAGYAPDHVPRQAY